MRLGHIAEFLTVDVAKTRVVVGDAPLHLALALRRYAVLVADVVHQIMIVAAAEVAAHHIEAQRVEFAEEVIVAVENIDVGETVAVRSHLPECRAFHLVQVLGTQELRVLLGKFLGIRHHRRLEVQILHDLLREDRRVAPPVLEHEEERALGQLLSLAIVVENVLLRDGHIALALKLGEMAAQLFLADERRCIAVSVDAEVGEGDEALVLCARRRSSRRVVRLEREKKLHEHEERCGDAGELQGGAHLLAAVLAPRKGSVMKCGLRFRMLVLRFRLLVRRWRLLLRRWRLLLRRLLRFLLLRRHWRLLRRLLRFRRGLCCRRRLCCRLPLLPGRGLH